MDNVFVFVVIFAFFGVPLKYQYRVLFWGILGAIVMRLTFILVASAVARALRMDACISSARFWFTRASSWPRRTASRRIPDQNIVLRLARRVSAASPTARTATSSSSGRTASCS